MGWTAIVRGPFRLEIETLRSAPLVEYSSNRRAGFTVKFFGNDPAVSRIEAVQQWRERWEASGPPAPAHVTPKSATLTLPAGTPLALVAELAVRALRAVEGATG